MNQQLKHTVLLGMVEARSVNVKNTHTHTRMYTGTGTTITGTRIGSGRVEERRSSARNRRRLVDAMWETGQTWLERGKKVEQKKGLVQYVAANPDNLESIIARKQGRGGRGGHKVPRA